MDLASRYDIDNAVGYAVGHAAARIKIALRRAFLAAGHDVTPDQWVVLYRLLENEGLTQVALGERTVKDKTTVTRILDRLEARELLTRRRAPDDRRSQRLYLTEAGRTLALALVPIVQAFADAAYADLTGNDKAVLRDLLTRIEARLDCLPETKDAP
ncbi:MarR family winged helix-turn-helix transcriptional regulator [Solidesulfovibrio magneticus]|uniref:MarR family transcriptional regulator n=1 Tax=Solidesulfovibrio magneticus (strain ATCC 700980 / DSM 13731 / RS-1) TaxID=573370 RepID=C4XJW9_SOLM1|nr:MarR family transcriptional regulator [Solidesulfovibrio magneticus]BAH74324.1 MarR family transcriptional regulator [Solidesulfovibrio magneticus RS-1]